MKKDLKELEKNIKVKFTNKNLLKQALTHRSYINEHQNDKLGKIGHNERLEFLGDAVLELVVTESLYKKYTNPEGELTNWRASLVNAKMLSTIAKEINLDDFLYLSKGEAQDKNSKARSYILANALEALIGAIYLDKGLKKTKQFVDKFILIKLKEIIEKQLYLDPKSRFQEFAQDKYTITPNYKVLAESGPDHKKHFIVGVYLGNKLITQGEGYSKQEAQVDAAEKALEIEEL